jgi:hypothetical protein
MIESFLLQLELKDGYGMHSDFKYYTINWYTWPVDTKKGVLDDEVLHALQKKYPYDQKIHNSGYHNWSVISMGSEYVVEQIYKVYQDTVINKKILRGMGIQV